MQQVMAVLEHRAGEVAKALGLGEDLRGRIGRDAVGEGVLRCARGEARREAGQHRCVPEQLARAHQVEDPSVVDDLHGPGPDHPQELDALGTLREDGRPGRVEFDLH